MTVPGMWGIERFGRRRLLLVGAIGMCLCEYIVAIIGVTISVENIAGQKVLIAFVCFYIVGSVLFVLLWLNIELFSRHSLPLPGVLLLGLSPVKSSLSKFVPKPCRSQSVCDVVPLRHHFC